MTRAKFESLVLPLIDQTIACCKQAVIDADINPSDIQEVILTGGMTQMPLVLIVMMVYNAILTVLLGTTNSATVFWDISK